MKKFTLLVITAMLTIVLLTAGCTEDDNGEEEEQLETAPTFTLESTDNDTIKLSSYQGKVVLLDFEQAIAPAFAVERLHRQHVEHRISLAFFQVIGQQDVDLWGWHAIG